MFLEFYGLNEQPFGVTPDPRFLYMGPAQQEALSSLIYGIEMGRGFMALIASPGLGKTTILLQLMQRLRESTRTAFLFHTHTNSEEFLRSLLADLDIEPCGHNLGDLQRQLGDVLIEEARAGKRIVVAIDEAQNLDDKILEMVRMLSNFETPQAKLLQIVLVGQPQLADKLRSPHLEQLRQRVSIITHFPPLADDDIPRYIDHRLRVAGYTGGVLFTLPALRLIVAHSKGIPRNINNLCFHAMSLGYAKNQKKIDDAILREVITDLSLDSLGTPRASMPETSAAAIGFDSAAWGGRGTSPDDSIPSSISLDDGPRRVQLPHDSPLDSVVVSPQVPVGYGNTLFAGWNAAGGRVPASRDRKQRVRPLFWLSLAVLVGYLAAGPWLKASLNSLREYAAGGELWPNSHPNKAVSPAHTPANMDFPGNHTDPAESQSTLTKDAGRLGPRSEYSTPLSTEPASGEPLKKESIASAINPSSSPETRRPRTKINEAFPATELGSAPDGGRLIVQSSVSGARISINGRSDPTWRTPHLFSLPPATYVVSVYTGGYTSWIRHVRVDGGQEKWVMAQIENREGGVYTVDTDPPGMPVFIDGKSFGRSRVDVVLNPGWHVCEVIPQPGHEPLIKRFHIGPGEALTRKIRLVSSSTSLRNEAGRGE